jgi:hypothetical protein
MIEYNIIVNLDNGRIMIIETCASCIEVSVLMFLEFRSDWCLEHFPVAIVGTDILIILITLLEPKFVTSPRF